MTQMLKVSEVAKIFNVTNQTVRQWLVDGSLRGIKIGKGYYWRIPADAVDELANRRYGDDSDE